MCLAIVWRAWWWRGGKGSFDRKRRVEIGDVVKGKKNGHGVPCPYGTLVTFRGNSVRGGRSGRGRWARAKPFCRGPCFLWGGEALASGTSRLLLPRLLGARGL